jgi:hypothetical protein
MNSKFFIFALTALLLMGCDNGPGAQSSSAQAPAAATSTVSSDEIRQLAEDAYAYGLQQVIFYQTRYNYTQNSETNVYEGVNRWNLVNKGDPIDPSFKAIVTPNATTAYAIGFLDIQNEPVVLEMPEVDDRYFALQLMDPYGIFWLYAGNQFNGTAANSYLIIPQGYAGDIPDEFVTTQLIEVPAKTLTGIIRYARIDPTDGEKDVNHIKDLLARSTITPLSKWVANGNQGLSVEQQSVIEGSYKTFPRMQELTTAQVDNQTAEDFFNYLSFVLNDPSMVTIKDSKMEGDMLVRLAAIDVAKGKSFAWGALDSDAQAALSEGFEAGRAGVKQAGTANLIDMNGWGVIRNSGGFATNWIDRAVMADFGWLGPDRNISHGAAFAFNDSEGKPLTGEQKYTLTFDINDLPPVEEFWELPMYDASGYFIANEINRYSINSFFLKQGLLHVEGDKLVIYMQHEKPSDPQQVKNWLPTPAEGFRLTPRFYGPKYPLVDGSYDMPKIMRVE